MIKLQEIIASGEYDFLRTDERLMGKLMFLVLGGSHAYGTSTPNSDIDIRGCAFNGKSDLIGFGSFEQVVDVGSDTTIYGFNKLIRLLCDCNPNAIEMLGSKAEHYLFYGPAAKGLLDIKKLFLSKKAAESFGGYANAQLRRLKNALVRDSCTQAEKERHMLDSIKLAMRSFADRYAEMPRGSICLSVGDSDKKRLDEEIFVDASLKHYPLRDFRAILSDMGSIVRDCDKLTQRNKKKDDIHLNKHAMHLVRLHLMCLDILEKEEINTYRENDLDLLMGIRNGKYQKEGGGFRREFFDVVAECENRLDYAAKNTGLPENPDYGLIEEFVISVNEQVVRGEHQH